MKYNPIEEQYLEWLCEIVREDDTHDKLLRRLYYHTFDPILIKRDENRARDGEDLREMYGEEIGLSRMERNDYLYNHSCSILEMLVSMSIRCEGQIMHDPDLGNRTSKWFWMMLENMGIAVYDDANYNEQAIDEAVEVLIFRDFKHDGSGGGIFVLPGTQINLRNVEFWYHMCWGMNEYIRNEEK